MSETSQEHADDEVITYVIDELTKSEAVRVGNAKQRLRCLGYDENNIVKIYAAAMGLALVLPCSVGELMEGMVHQGPLYKKERDVKA